MCVCACVSLLLNVDGYYYIVTNMTQGTMLQRKRDSFFCVSGGTNVARGNTPRR